MSPLRRPPTIASLRVGTDLCAVADVAAAVDRFGDRYLERIYTPAELAYCTRDPACTAERLAARFAAKEAAVKVLRPSGPRPDWRSIEVRREPDGSCELDLSGAALALADDAGVTSLAVSLSHEGPLASAVVVALLEPPEAPLEAIR